jgi:hypothetical protein
MSRKTARILLVFVAAGLVFAGVVAGWALYYLRLAPTPSLWAELAVILAMTWLVARHPRVRSAREGAGRVQCGVILFMVAAATYAHLISIPQLTYPYLHWSMYSEPEPWNHFNRYHLHRDIGEVEHLPFGEGAPPGISRAVMHSFDIMVDSAAAASSEHALRLETAARTLVGNLNSRRPVDPYDRLTIERCVVVIRGAGIRTPLCERLFDFEFE